MPTSLSAVNVTVDYGALVALDSLTLSLEPGEILGLLGPNGSGKSTLVDVLSGVRVPTAGHVEVDGEVLGTGARGAVRRGVARTFQNLRLFDELTVLENVEIAPLALRGAGGRHAGRDLAWQLVDDLGIADRALDPVTALSYGDRRRVEIARALAASPRYLLLDEPAAGMNDVESAALAERIRWIRDTRETAVLLIEHDVSLVFAVAERVAVLNQGRLIASGDPDAVRRDPEVIAAYLGSPRPSAA